MVVLSVEEVAGQLGCRCLTVLKLIRRGSLHPVMLDNEPCFDPQEIAAVRYVPIGEKIVKLVPR